MYEGIVQDLIDELGRLPGIGPKSAQRLAFHILKTPREQAERLADAVRETGKPVETEPLNSYERRLIHDAYREDPDLETKSQQIEAKLKRIFIRKRG